LLNLSCMTYLNDVPLVISFIHLSKLCEPVNLFSTYLSCKSVPTCTADTWYVRTSPVDVGLTLLSRNHWPVSGTSTLVCGSIASAAILLRSLATKLNDKLLNSFSVSVIDKSVTTAGTSSR